jgi:hypothetical protein
LSWLAGKIGIPESWSLNPGLQFFPDQPDPHGDRPGIFFATFERRF